MQQLSFLPLLTEPKHPRRKEYRIADIPIVKPKPYQRDPWEAAGVSFEDVNLADERARILNQGKKTM